LSIAAANLLDGFFNGHVEDCVAGWVEKVNEAFDVGVAVHEGIT
jgi:hypothetical protein